MKKRLLLLFVFSLSFWGLQQSFAQDNKECKSPVSFDLGADLVSRYVWRGVEFGENTPHFQPWASMTLDMEKSGAIVLGAWGSYGFNTGFAENDIFLSYAVESRIGTFGLSISDYYYPNGGKEFTELDDDGKGAHTIEVGFSYALPEAIPITIFVSNNVYNEEPENNSLYTEVGYSFSLKGIAANIFIGGALGKSNWHGVTTDNFEIVNTGFTLSKNIDITDQFSLPLSASWIYNAHTKKSFLVMGVSL